MCVCNIGFNPTFNDVKSKILEAHLPDYTGDDFYGEEVEVILMGWVRGERKFEGVEELKKQIGEDVENGVTWLKDIPGCLGRGFEGGEGEVDWRDFMQGNKLGRHYLG